MARKKKLNLKKRIIKILNTPLRDLIIFLLKLITAGILASLCFIVFLFLAVFLSSVVLWYSKLGLNNWKFLLITSLIGIGLTIICYVQLWRKNG